MFCRAGTVSFICFIIPPKLTQQSAAIIWLVIESLIHLTELNQKSVRLFRRGPSANDDAADSGRLLQSVTRCRHSRGRCGSVAELKITVQCLLNIVLAITVHSGWKVPGFDHPGMHWLHHNHVAKGGEGINYAYVKFIAQFDTLNHH